MSLDIFIEGSIRLSFLMVVMFLKLLNSREETLVLSGYKSPGF